MLRCAAQINNDSLDSCLLLAPTQLQAESQGPQLTCTVQDSYCATHALMPACLSAENMDGNKGAFRSCSELCLAVTCCQGVPSRR